MSPSSFMVVSPLNTGSYMYIYDNTVKYSIVYIYNHIYIYICTAKQCYTYIYMYRYICIYTVIYIYVCIVFLWECQ